MKYLLLLISISLMACNDESYQKIEGSWVCAQWIISPAGTDNCDGNVYFLFNSDKTYLSRIGELEQSGRYEIINKQLTCYPEGSMKIGVEINSLSTDTLSLTMNRSGQREELVLVRE